MPVPGFERRTFMCSACHDVEGRLVFVRPGQQSDAEPMSMDAAPSISDEQIDYDAMPPTDTAPPISDEQIDDNPMPVDAAPPISDEQIDRNPMPVDAPPSISDEQIEHNAMPPTDTEPSIAPASAVQDEDLCVPKIRFCSIGDEGRREQAVM
jgi:hypothetical protein